MAQGTGGGGRGLFDAERAAFNLAPFAPRLEGPGSAARLRELQVRFRRASPHAEGLPPMKLAALGLAVFLTVLALGLFLTR